MKAKWKHYVASMAYDNPLEYYTKVHGGNEQIANLEMILTSLPSDDDLSSKYKIVENVDDMVFGQFMACERALSTGLPREVAFRELAINVLRPIGDDIFDNTDEKKELLHIASLDDEHAPDVMFAITKFSQKRRNFVHRKYNGVFYKESSDEKNEDEDDEVEPLTTEEKYAKNWYWYVIMRELASEDIFKYEEVLMLPMSMVAPELAYRRHTERIAEIKRRREESFNQTIRR